MAKRGLPWSRRGGAVPAAAPRCPGVPSLRFGGSSCPPLHGLPGYQCPGGVASGHAPRTSHGRRTVRCHDSRLTRSAAPASPGASRGSPRASYPARTLARARPGTAPPSPSAPNTSARQTAQAITYCVVSFSDETHEPDLVTAPRRAVTRARPMTGDRKHARRGDDWPFDWRCTWPGASRTTHLSGICRPPLSSVGTGRSTGCVCRASTPMPSSQGCSAPRSTDSGGWGPPTRRKPSRRPPTAAATGATRSSWSRSGTPRAARSA